MCPGCGVAVYQRELRGLLCVHVDSPEKTLDIFYRLGQVDVIAQACACLCDCLVDLSGGNE